MYIHNIDAMIAFSLSLQDSLVSRVECGFCICCCRLFHIDDVPSGAGGETIDFNKAYAVGTFPLITCLETFCVLSVW